MRVFLYVPGFLRDPGDLFKSFGKRDGVYSAVVEVPSPVFSRERERARDARTPTPVSADGTNGNHSRLGEDERDVSPRPETPETRVSPWRLLSDAVAELRPSASCGDAKDAERNARARSETTDVPSIGVALADAKSRGGGARASRPWSPAASPTPPASLRAPSSSPRRSCATTTKRRMRLGRRRERRMKRRFSRLFRAGRPRPQDPQDSSRPSRLKTLKTLKTRRAVGCGVGARAADGPGRRDERVRSRGDDAVRRRAGCRAHVAARRVRGGVARDPAQRRFVHRLALGAGGGARRARGARARGRAAGRERKGRAEACYPYRVLAGVRRGASRVLVPGRDRERARLRVDPGPGARGRAAGRVARDLGRDATRRRRARGERGRLRDFRVGFSFARLDASVPVPQEKLGARRAGGRGVDKSGPSRRGERGRGGGVRRARRDTGQDGRHPYRSWGWTREATGRACASIRRTLY